jgi:YidC/Oxa1 family membrane protein insertase
MFHAINSVHMTYNKGAFDYYDTIFCVGPHHEAEIRKTEEVYQLEPKQLINVGYSWLEDIEAQYMERVLSDVLEREKILIAPSWNDDNILETCIETILDKILLMDYDVIVRPHPEYIKRQELTIKQLHDKYSHHSNFILETNSVSSESIQESSLLITDWSGIGIEYALGMGKPVIYIDTPKKIHNLEYEKLDIVPLEVRIRNTIGKVIVPSECSEIDREIQDIMNNGKVNKAILQNERNENIFNWGRSGEVGADYIINYCLENSGSRKLKD